MRECRSVQNYYSAICESLSRQGEVITMYDLIKLLQELNVPAVETTVVIQPINESEIDEREVLNYQLQLDMQTDN